MATHAGGLTVPEQNSGQNAGPADRTTGQAADRTSTTAAAPTVVVEGLVRRFGDRTVLAGVDLAIRPGEFVALLGPSGSGKSTLLRALAGLDLDAIAEPRRTHARTRGGTRGGPRGRTRGGTRGGGVHGDGTIEVPARRAVVFQDSRLLPWERVLGNVTLGLADAGARARGVEALAEVGLAGRERAWPYELSGGEQQRVALARSLVREPELLLADEPFGALDALTRIRMHELLRQLCQRHRPAVLLVTHDVDEAITLADRVLVLGHGRIDLSVPVELEEPRQSDDPAFVALRLSLLLALGVRAGGGSGPGEHDVPTTRTRRRNRAE